MKIGYDAKRMFKNRTGLGRYSTNLVYNYAQNFPKDQLVLFANNIDKTSSSEFTNVEYIDPHTKFPAMWRSYGIYDNIEEQKIDIYHGLSNELPFSIKKTKCKSVVTIHDLIFKIRPNDFKILDRNIYDSKTRFACKNADVIITVSEHTKSDLIKYLNISPDKIKVVYQSCDPIFFRSHYKESTTLKDNKIPDPYILSVGSIEPRKNLETTLRALDKIPASNRPHLFRQ